MAFISIMPSSRLSQIVKLYYIVCAGLTVLFVRVYSGAAKIYLGIHFFFFVGIVLSRKNERNGRLLFVVCVTRIILDRSLTVSVRIIKISIITLSFACRLKTFFYNLETYSQSLCLLEKFWPALRVEPTKLVNGSRRFQ